METNYCTNEVEYKINHLAVLDDYDLIQIEILEYDSKKKYFDIWNYLKKSIKVLSYNKIGSKIYLLTQKKEISKFTEKEIEKYNFDLKLIDKQSINKISENILLNLLIGLYGTSGNMFTLGNFQNGCYLIHKKFNSKVITLRFSVDKNNLLYMNVVTFSKIKCTKKNEKKYNFFAIDGSRLINTTQPLDADTDLFILKNSGKKSSIDFMNFEEDFLKSKVGYLSFFLKGINRSLNKFISINLKQEAFIQYKLLSNNEKKLRILEFQDTIIAELIKYKCLEIIDYENKFDEEFKLKLINNISSFFGKKLEIKFVSEINKFLPTFIFLDEKDDYKENDPYEKLKEEFKFTQVISYTNSKDLISSNILLEVLLKELLIKGEIINKKFFLVKKWEIYYDYEFFINIDNEKDLYKKVLISKNQISFSDLNLFDELKINKIKNLKNDCKNIELIGYKNNDYFIVTRTNQYMLPDPLKSLDIYDNFMLNNEKPRLRRVDYQSFTTGGMGINYKINNKCLTYFSALHNKSLKKTLSKATVIRKVYFNNENFDYINFLSTLDEYFVKNKDLTVLPFVVKYLREYLNIELP